MLMTDDGHWVGAISGGCLEGDALRRSREVILAGKPRVVTYDTTDDESAQSLGVGLGCNGIIEVIIEPIPESNDSNPIDLLKTFLANRDSAALATIYGIEGDVQAAIGQRMMQKKIDGDVIKLVSRDVCEKHKIVPVSRSGSSLIVAMSDPTNLHAIDDIKFLTGYNVEPVVASEIAIRESIEKYYGSQHALELKKVMDEMAEQESEALEVLEEEEELDATELEAATEDAPVVKLVNIILTDSIKKVASDIHIEPYEKDFRVRVRIDGVLYEIMHQPMKLKDAITSRLKIMA
jgi:hypothetical protein